ncbi:hypothetical protein RCMENCHIE_59 [Rhodobacter phage RcMenchie]|nr:hypothetical protein RCMENCHIE_59 [Rhodobacter phage RcMenchie]
MMNAMHPLTLAVIAASTHTASPAGNDAFVSESFAYAVISGFTKSRAVREATSYLALSGFTKSRAVREATAYLVIGS